MSGPPQPQCTHINAKWQMSAYAALASHHGNQGKQGLCGEI